MLSKVQKEMLAALANSSRQNPVDLSEKFDFIGNADNYAEYLSLCQRGLVDDNNQGSWLTSLGADSVNAMV